MTCKESPTPRGINWELLRKEQQWYLDHPCYANGVEEDHSIMLLFLIAAIQQLAVEFFHVPFDEVYDIQQQVA